MVDLMVELDEQVLDMPDILMVLLHKEVPLVNLEKEQQHRVLMVHRLLMPEAAEAAAETEAAVEPVVLLEAALELDMADVQADMEWLILVVEAAALIQKEYVTAEMVVQEL